MLTATTLLIAIIVMGSIVVECITGFGATILGLSFLTMLIDVKSAVALMTMVSLINGICILITSWKSIDFKTLKTILICAGLGLPIGMLLFSFLPERWLKLFLGLFVTINAAKSLIQIYIAKRKKADASLQAPPKPAEKLLLFAGGIVHGAFASGGPLIVLYVSKVLKDKSAFRSTMTATWVVLNSLLLIKNICIGGIVTTDLLKVLLISLPFLACGALIGNILHKRVSIGVFSLLINVLLLIAGLSTLINQLLQ